MNGDIKMSKEYNNNDYLNKRSNEEVLKPKVPEGDPLISEEPEGEPLWKKKKKINEDKDEDNILNESI